MGKIRGGDALILEDRGYLGVARQEAVAGAFIDRFAVSIGSRGANGLVSSNTTAAQGSGTRGGRMAGREKSDALSLGAPASAAATYVNGAEENATSAAAGRTPPLSRVFPDPFAGRAIAPRLARRHRVAPRNNK